MTALSQWIRIATALLLVFSSGLLGAAQEDGYGVLAHEEGALEGYTLIAPQFYTSVYLIDNQGRLVKEWAIGRHVREAHLLENGNIMVVKAPADEIDRSLYDLGYLPDGAIAEYAWDGELVWEKAFLGAEQRHHHGIDIMPNGNILALLWDYHHIDEALARGMDRAIAAADFEDIEVFLPDIVVEIDNPSGDIIWTWDAWDHLIQDYDESLPNFGSPSDNPQRIDINYQQYFVKDIPTAWSAGPHDWMHSNMVNYNPELDQIVISVLRFDEFWIFDHSHSTEDSAGPAGDLLYRWGNPLAYEGGDMVADRKLFQQHDAQWIDAGLPGEGNILIYNNRNNVVREDELAEDEYSSVLEIRLPLRDDGGYDWSAEAEIVWQYDEGFYSRIISGVQRLPNGNTLITAGVPGRVFEVTAPGELVWEFVWPAEEDVNPWIFRARKYAADHPGFAGKDLSPGPMLGA